MGLGAFIKKRSHLVWYVKNPEELSPEAVVEAVLNYGDFEDVKKLFSIVGIKETARIFRKQMRRTRVNYDPKVAHYFRLYFEKYA